MKLKLVRIIKIICFCMATVLMVSGLTDLLKPKWLENRWISSKTNKSFYKQEKNSNEVIFFGASNISAAVDPLQLYEDYGISSYNLGVMSQPMIGTYYWFKEALNTPNIKLAVVEIKSAGRSSEKAEKKARKSYDYMNWGINKIQYALEYKNFHKEADGTDEEINIWSYLFPLSLYHTRWSELTYDDYDFFLGNNNSYTRGFSVLSTKFKNSESYDTTEAVSGKYDGFDVDTDKEEEPNPINVEYTEKLIKLAKKKGVKLLFVKTPDTKWNVEQHNYIQKVADNNNIEFIDMNLKSYRKEIGYNYAEDSADTVHVNFLGARKITKYLGKYISENYQLTDFRKVDGSVKKAFEDSRDTYNSAIKEGELSLITNIDEYLKKISDDNYGIIFASGSNVRNVTFTEAQSNLLKELGVSDKMFTQSKYGTDFISVVEKDKVKNKVKNQNSSNTKSITLVGTFGDGTDYKITADSSGSTVKLNNNAYSDIKSYGFNIIVFDKKLKRVVDSVYLYSDNNVTTMHRGE